MSGAHHPTDGDATVTAGPSLTNPQALHTVDELRAELDRANGLLTQSAADLHMTRCAAQDMARAMGQVVVPYLCGNAEGVASALKAFCERYVKMAVPGGGTLQ